MALRHGQSEANVAGIVSSHPDVATVTHGLTDLGREQATGAVDTIKEGGGLTHVVVYSSDFKRAWETAEIFCAGLRDAWQDTDKLVIGPCVDVRLRERWFGEHDGMSDNPDADGSLGGYPAVWAEDAVDATHEKLGVESVASVVGRASQVVAELEAQAGPPLVGAAAGAAHQGERDRGRVSGLT
jgi:probable phosphoglycerate mutase